MHLHRRSAEQLRILVVEPRDLVAARLKAQLERLGHLVLGPARDGREAVAAAQRLHPSLILMDNKLPGLNGIETARAIVTDRPVPVILLTDYAGAELVRRAREAGVVADVTALGWRRRLSALDGALEDVRELRGFQRAGDRPGPRPGTPRARAPAP